MTTIYENLPGPYLDGFSRKADNSFDIVSLPLGWRSEYHDIASLKIGSSELNDYPSPSMDGRLHIATFNLERFEGGRTGTEIPTQ
ncbi:MAG: hypothetical protein QOH71_3798 [Blastocatellia bacterium]|jgi:hypothetical protein|nr:hypothetical protein [Blastocatellia bacterium]